MSEFDNEQDLTGAVIEKIRQLFQNRTAVMIMAAVVVIAAAIIITASVISGNSPENFDTPSVLAQTAEEEKSLSFSKNGLAVTVRISDICTFDSDTGEAYSSLYYSDKNENKYVFADYIIKNNSSKDVTINCGAGSENSYNLFLGYFHDDSDKWGEDDAYDFCASYCLYDRKAGTDVSGSEVVIGARKTKEFTLRYTIRADRINDCSGIYFCGKYDPSDVSSKYAMMGIGKPVISYGFKNSQLFPQIIYDETKAAEAYPGEDDETDVYTRNDTGSPSKYSMKKIGSDSPALFFINNIEDSPYKLSVEIAADGDPESNLAANVSGYSTVMDNESIQGPVVELKYIPGLEVEKVRIIFEIKPEAVRNTLGTYVGMSDEFNGIRRFNVFMYNEEINTQLPVETFFDLDNNIVYAETDRFGTYALVDMEIWFNMMDISPDSFS